MTMRNLFLFASMVIASLNCNNAFAQQVVETNRNQFRIPFDVENATASNVKPVEMQLFVSKDRGRSWLQTAAVKPHEKSFRYRAAEDGEYWFEVRMLDSFNNTHPATNEHTPSLKVRVDTSPPVVDLQLMRVDAKNVGLKWNVSTAGFNGGRFKLEYSNATPGSKGMPRWNPIAIVPSSKGGTMFSVERPGKVSVRCTAQDAAGNVARVTEKIDLASVPRVQASTEKENNGDMPLLASTAGVANSTKGPGLMLSSNVSSSVVELPPSGSGAQPHLQTPPKQESSVKRRLVSKTSFQINYKLDGTGPSGVSRVDFFISEDGGKKWWKYGDDPDRLSPFMIQVPKDGVYGFAIRASSGAGLTEPPPQPGDQPDVVVEVDTARPSLQLKPIEPVSVAGARVLKIRWAADDANLSALPIGLYYSQTKDGPWESASGWVGNTGEYTWRVGKEVPTQVYLRLAARDKAGNTAHMDTQRPVVVDTARPSVRIIDVVSGN